MKYSNHLFTDVFLCHAVKVLPRGDFNFEEYRDFLDQITKEAVEMQASSGVPVSWTMRHLYNVYDGICLLRCPDYEDVDEEGEEEMDEDSDEEDGIYFDDEGGEEEGDEEEEEWETDEGDEEFVADNVEPGEMRRLYMELMARHAVHVEDSEGEVGEEGEEEGDEQGDSDGEEGEEQDGEE